MGKVIMVSDDVYEKLNRIKNPGESFSNVIKRLLDYKPKLMSVAGAKTITVKEWELVKKIFEKQEELDDIKRKYLLELMKK